MTALDPSALIDIFTGKGARTGLVLYPAQRVVRIFEPGGHSRLVRGAELVRIDWLTGFAVPAERFFAGL